MNLHAMARRRGRASELVPEKVAGSDHTIVRTQTCDHAELTGLMTIDEQTSALFEAAGLDLGWPPTHPMVMAERERWGWPARKGAPSWR